MHGLSSATNTDVAIFGNNNGAAGTVAVKAAGVSAGGITFNPAGSGNYTLGGGAITLTGTAPTVTANTAAIIASVIAGAHGLIKAGSGTLVLTAAETYSDDTRITGGRSSSAAGASLGGSTNVTVLPDRQCPNLRPERAEPDDRQSAPWRPPPRVLPR